MRKFKQKFFLSRLSIFSILALAGFAAYFYFQQTRLFGLGAQDESPNLYSPVWRDSFSEGMVLPASCESPYYYEHASGECATPSCTVSFNPSAVSAGKNTVYYWNFSNNTAYYQTSCTADLGSQEGPVPSYAAYNGYNSGIYPKQTQTCATTVRTAGGATASCSASVIVNPLGVNPEASCPAGQNFADFAALGTPPGGTGVSDPVIGGWSNGDLAILMEAPYGYPFGLSQKTIWEKKGSVAGSGFSQYFDWKQTVGSYYNTSGRPKVVDEIIGGNPGPAVYAQLIKNSVTKVLKYISPLGNWMGAWSQTTVSTSNFGTAGPSSVSVPGVGIFKVSGRGPVMLQKCQGSQTLSVLRAGAGSGNVTSASNPSQASQINCGGTCSASFAYNADVTLSAAPNVNSKFIGWSGAGCSGTGSCVVKMDAAKSVTATFAPLLADLIPLNPGVNSLVSGNRLSFSVTIKNQGAGFANVSRARMSLDVGNKGSFNYTSPQIRINALGSGSSQTISWPNVWTAAAGTHKLRIQADSQYVISESNEPNNVLDWIFTVLQANRAPVAVAKISTDGVNYANSATVTKGVPTTIYLSAASSSDPDGWIDSANGVSIGGYLQWNSDLNQGAPTFETTFNNPASPGILSLGSRTFNDAPGTYTYQVLQINDMQGAQSNIATVQVTVAAPLSVSKTGSGKGRVTSNPGGIFCQASQPGLKSEYDINSDGLYDKYDSDAVFRMSISVEACPAGKICDLDGSGKILAGDSLLLKQMIVDCSESYPANTSVALIAAPDAGSVFSGWGGACSGAGGCNVLMNDSKSVIANFSQKPYIALNPVTFSFSGISGGATPPAQTLVIQNTGAAVLNWTGVTNQNWCHLSSGSGSVVSGASQNTIISVDAPSNVGTFNCTVTISDANAGNSPQTALVTYTVSQSYNLIIAKAGSGNGAVTSDSAGINCTATMPGLKSEYDINSDGKYDSQDPNFIQSVVVGNNVCPAGKICDINNNGKFDISDALLLAQTINGCQELYGDGTPVTLTAAPSAGSAFAGWTGSVAGFNLSIPLTMNSNKTVNAAFNPLPPSAPSGLLTSDSSACPQVSATLNWTDNSGNETGFKIERKTGAGGSWSEIAAVGANATTYQNIGLDENTAYVWRVRAYNDGGDSGYSNESGLTTPDCPSAIENLLRFRWREINPWQ